MDTRADWAASGLVVLTGRHDAAPLVPPGGAATVARDAAARFGELAACIGRRVEVDGRRLLGERAALLGLRRRGPWSLRRSCRAVRTNDGWCALSLARPSDFESVPALVERATAPTTPPGAWRAVAHWARAGTAAEVAARAQLLGLAAGPIPPPRGVGEQAASTSRPPATVRTLAEGTAPLAGRTPLVVDLSALWAGPLTGHLLSRAGARVIKVESPTRLDGARSGSAPFYGLLHGGHESVVLDFGTASGREQLRALLRRADVVIESSRPRALEQLGVDVDSICRETPTTWIAIRAYGEGQGRSNWVGFGDDVAMAAGMVAWGDSRSGERVPFPCGDALADPLTGLHALVPGLEWFLRGGSHVLEVSMHRAVAGSMAFGETSSIPAQRNGRDWLIETEHGFVPAAAPAARRPLGHVASPGADTARVLRETLR